MAETDKKDAVEETTPEKKVVAKKAAPVKKETAKKAAPVKKEAAKKAAPKKPAAAKTEEAKPSAKKAAGKNYEARLKARFNSEIAGELHKEFKFKSVMQIPRIEKIIVSAGVGDAITNKKFLDSVVSE
jgi:hypothetical protein